MGSLFKRGRIYFGKLRDLDGEPVRYSTGQRDPIKAAAILAEWERRVAAGLPAMPDEEERRAAAAAKQRREEQRNLTLHKLCEMYMDPVEGYRRPRIKSMTVFWSTYGSYIRRAIQAAPIASTKAAAVRRLDVEKWRDGFLVENYAPRTVNVILGLLRGIYNWALDRELLDMRNPCRGVEEVPVTDRAAIFELPHMQRLLVQPARPMLRAMLYAVTLGGLRHGELAGWRRADLHLDGPTPHAIIARSYRTTPKSGKPRPLPLHPALVEELRAWLAQAPPSEECEDLVFPVYRPKLRVWRMAAEDDMHGLPELLEAAGCPLPRAAARRGREEGNCRAWHALRHTFASRCRACGIPREIITELLGHSAVGNATTEIYLHDSPEHLQRLASELGRLWYLEPPAAPASSTATPSPTTALPAPQPAQEEEPIAKVFDIAAARAARAARRTG